jgi:hypothetical protein
MYTSGKGSSAVGLTAYVTKGRKEREREREREREMKREREEMIRSLFISFRP